MPRSIKLKVVIKVLEKNGFLFISQKGSHAKFRREGDPTKTVIIKTTKKEIPYGTFRSILLQSDLKENDFMKVK
ncbi:MAG: type II toxin-antitoxin system HicA family toxin [Patescibacteria group bacterium]